MPVKDYNADPDLNTQISGINIAEGCAPSGINNAIRQLMADVKEEFEGEEGAVSALRALIAEEVAKCLKLTGGTMTGPIYVDNTAIIGQYTNGRLGFAASAGKAAMLNLFGRYLEGDYAGAVELIAENDDNRSTLALFPDGHCDVNGTHVLTSAGGTMTGSLLVSNILSGANNGFGLYGGNAWRTGGYIELGGPNHTYPNHIQIKGGSRQLLEDLGIGWHINGSPIVTLTSSWRSGNDWYRKYSDGWIEQGGEIWVSGVATHTISLNTPFSNTVYTVVASQAALGTGGGEWVNGQSITNRTTTSFDVYDVRSGGHTLLWYACGN